MVITLHRKNQMTYLLIHFLFLILASGPAALADFIPKPVQNLAPQCQNDTDTWFKALETIALVSLDCLRNQKCSAIELQILEANAFAIQQLDAFGKFPVPGMLELTTVYDGSYQECQRISGKKYDTNYCYVVLKPGKNASCAVSTAVTITDYPLRLAVCLPESCDQTDMLHIFNAMSLYPFTACSIYCSKTEVEKDSAFWGFSIFLIAMVAIALFASLVDYIRDSVFGIHSSKENNGLLKILLAFSFWTNAEQILSVKEQKPGFIKSLDCIRLFSMCWVVTGHSFIYFTLADSLTPLINFPKHFWNHLLLNALVSVDTFFVLSGIVVAYLFFKLKPGKQMVTSPITWIMFYVHRYLRLTPPVMLFIGFFAVYAPYIQGPFSASQLNQLVTQADSCKTGWWWNLLYINNYADAQDNCYGPTWYLAVDTQLYFVVPIILIAFYFSFAAGAGLIVVGCAGSIIATYILYSVYDLPADFFGNGDVTNFNNILYTKPWIRCPPYLVGILTGYVLATYGARKLRLNRAVCVGGWIIAFAIAGLCLFINYDYDKGSKWSVFSRASYYNFDRLGWGIFISWVVLANHFGWGGPINNFMSHPIWQPFGRLSYCAYIVHWYVLFYYLNVGERPLHYYSAWEVFFYVAIPATFFSYILAFFWSCLFEVPTLKLEKMLIDSLMGSGSRKLQDQVQVENGIKKSENTWDEKDSDSTKL